MKSFSFQSETSWMDSDYEKVAIVSVTPEMAQEALKRNKRNRSISSALVARYRYEIENGTWFLTHQGIAFTSTHELADGQHRLRALIEAKATLKMIVVTGLSAEAAAAIDRHRPRSEADSLRISGFSPEDLKTRIAVIRTLFRVHGAPHKITIPTSVMRQILDVISDELDIAIAVLPTHSHLAPAPIRAGIVSGLCAGSITVDLAQTFGRIMKTGETYSISESAILRLRDHLLSGARRQGGHTNAVELYLLCQRALKALTEGTPLKKLYLPSGPIWDVGFLFSDLRKQEQTNETLDKQIDKRINAV